jgi:hypothetical protein
MEEQAALRSPLIFVHQPPRKEWVGLTSEDIFEITERHTKEGGVCDGWIVAVEVQQKLKDKNT